MKVRIQVDPAISEEYAEFHDLRRIRGISCKRDHG